MWKTGTKFKKAFRYATAGFRALPDFIIIGAMKAGTTSLFSALTQHPKIIRSHTKETHFFNSHYHRGLYWYRSNFPFARRLAGGGKTGEATPQYIYHELVPERIHQTLPEVKLIAMLRNPTERTISQYFHEVRKGREDLPMMKAFRAEEERLAGVLRKDDFANPLYIHASYKKRGVYHEQIRRFLRYFPREQLLVLDSDEFFADPAGSIKPVFQFLEVDEAFPVDGIEHKNIGWNRTRVEPEVYEYLNDYFAPHNRELYSLLGRSFPW
ncbi:MAG: sulfotransferase domain-containing protein [Thermodesulfobacteriota bacterium]